MTDYNDGKWIGWNGGECPVHPETVVDAVASDDTSESHPVDMYSLKGGIKAGRISPQCWQHGKGYRHIIAFRVIKEHKEPREFWLISGVTFSTIERAIEFSKNSTGEIIHVREVLE